MNPIVVEVRGQVPAKIETVFDVFMPIELPTIMVGYGPLPAVAAIEDQTGDWDSVGESRIIRLADGHAMLETLTAVERPRRFAYTVSDLTNGLRYLVRRFHGSWTFEQSPGPAEVPVVLVRWRYEFEPRSIFARPLAAFVLRRFWRPCMEQALELAAAQLPMAEGERTES